MINAIIGIGPILKNTTVLLMLSVLFVQCGNQSENKNMEEKEQSAECCNTGSSTFKSETSEITCPDCGHKEVETLPTDVCVIKYNCTECGIELTPKDGDCCVFCTYGTHKCPSMQDE